MYAHFIPHVYPFYDTKSRGTSQQSRWPALLSCAVYQTIFVIVLTFGDSQPCVFLETHRRFEVCIMSVSVIQLWLCGRNVGGNAAVAMCRNWIAIYQTPTMSMVVATKKQDMKDALETLWTAFKISMRSSGPQSWAMLSPYCVLMIHNEHTRAWRKAFWGQAVARQMSQLEQMFRRSQYRTFVHSPLLPGVHFIVRNDRLHQVCVRESS